MNLKWITNCQIERKTLDHPQTLSYSRGGKAYKPIVFLVHETCYTQDYDCYVVKLKYYQREKRLYCLENGATPLPTELIEADSVDRSCIMIFHASNLKIISVSHLMH